MAFIFNPNKKRGVFMIPSGATKSPTPTPDPFTNTFSLAFDGIDDYVSTNSKIIASDITLSGWVNFNGSYSNFSAHFPMSITPSNTGVGNETLGRFYKDGSTLQIAIQCNDNTGANFSTYYVDNTTLEGAGWQHICITYNVTTKHIYAYLNGVAQNWVKIFAASTPVPFLTAVSTRIYESDLTIGRVKPTTSTGSFLGLVDEVSTYSRILTQEEITSIASAPTDLTSLSPNLWLRNGDNGTWKSPQWLIPNNINVANSRFSNYSFDYDGIDDSINTGFSSLDGASAFTISCWVNSSYTDWMNLFGDNSLNIATKPSITRCDLRLNGSVDFRSTNFVLNVGQWHNVVITFDGSLVQADRLKVYVDTVQVTNSLAGTPSTTFTASSDFRIGRSGTSGINEWNGKIDEFAVWDSVQDITSIYNSGVPSDISSLSPVGYWRSENSTFSTNWTVTDNGSGGNDGTSANMTIEDRVGDASNSSNNAVSFNQVEADRKTDVPT